MRMKDADCIDFLEWALPRLGMRWAGFRRVRGQVCGAWPGVLPNWG